MPESYLKRLTLSAISAACLTSRALQKLDSILSTGLEVKTHSLINARPTLSVPHFQIAVKFGT
jgi:hypothetical protein